MTYIEAEKEKAFAVIKNSIQSEYTDPDEDQQRAIDALDKQTGFNPDPVPLVEAATIEIMNKYTFVTIQETDQIWYYKDGVYLPGGEIIIAKEAEKKYHFEIKSSKVTEIKGHIMRLIMHEKNLMLILI